MTVEDLAMQRLINQRLVGSGFATPADVVRWLGAVQAQDYHGAKWAVGQRMMAATDAGLDAAFNAGEILRTHVLRPTWHFVAPEDIRWLLALTAPRVHALNAYMYRQLELDSPTLAQSADLIAGALAGGHALTREEIGSLLGRHGITAAGQRLGYIVMHAELDALICSGPLKGKQHTYALVDERAPVTPLRARDEAVQELVRRFFRSHGPSTTYDFAWWSGLTLADAREGTRLAAPDLDHVEIDGMTWWSGRDELGMPVQTPCVRLLPNYDEYFSRDSRKSGYPGAELERQRAEAAAGRLLVHHLVIDGAWRGGWRRRLTTRQVSIELDPFDDLKSREAEGLEAALASYGAFLQRAVVLA